jgi:hypothetical protein
LGGVWRWKKAGWAGLRHGSRLGEKWSSGLSRASWHAGRKEEDNWPCEKKEGHASSGKKKRGEEWAGRGGLSPKRFRGFQKLLYFWFRF